jgi:hypothetical protein
MEDHFLALQTYGYRDNVLPSEVKQNVPSKRNVMITSM